MMQKKGTGKKNENAVEVSKHTTETSVGSLVWGKLGKQPWWPGIIVDPAQCMMTSENPDLVCIYWLYDARVTNIPKRHVAEFQSNFISFFKEPKTKSYYAATILAIQEEAKRKKINIDEWDDEMCLAWAKNGFPRRKTFKMLNEPAELIPDFVMNDLRQIKDHKMKDLVKKKENSMSGRKRKINAPDDMGPNLPDIILENLQKIRQRTLGISAICLACRLLQVELVCPHPIFRGSLCRSCKNQLRKSMDLDGDEDKNETACAICGKEADGFKCSRPDCGRLYCTTCIEQLAKDDAKKKIDRIGQWKCFVCNDYDSSINGLIEKRVKDKRKCNELAKFFVAFGHMEPFPEVPSKKEKINVLSLFDGIATGLYVLKKLGFQVNNYFAAEVHDEAIKVSCVNNLENIQHLGDVRFLTEEKLKGLGKIDLLIGGSPCTELSLVNPARKGLFDPEATGILFFEFCRVLRLLQIMNKNHLFWFFENTSAMPLKYLDIINRNLGCEAVAIDAAWFSAQKRKRYFWGNIPELGKKFNFNADDYNLNDYLDPGLGRVATVKKLRTVTTNSNSLFQGTSMQLPVKENGNDSPVYITEIERVFGFPGHYTDVANLSAAKRQQLLGRSWSVPVIAHILTPLKPYFL